MGLRVLLRTEYEAIVQNLHILTIESKGFVQNVRAAAYQRAVQFFGRTRSETRASFIPRHWFDKAQKDSDEGINTESKHASPSYLRETRLLKGR